MVCGSWGGGGLKDSRFDMFEDFGRRVKCAGLWGFDFWGSGF